MELRHSPVLWTIPALNSFGTSKKNMSTLRDSHCHRLGRIFWLVLKGNEWWFAVYLLVAIRLQAEPWPLIWLLPVPICARRISPPKLTPPCLPEYELKDLHQQFPYKSEWKTMVTQNYSPSFATTILIVETLKHSITAVLDQIFATICTNRNRCYTHIFVHTKLYTIHHDIRLIFGWVSSARQSSRIQISWSSRGVLLTGTLPQLRFLFLWRKCVDISGQAFKWNMLQLLWICFSYISQQSKSRCRSGSFTPTLRLRLIRSTLRCQAFFGFPEFIKAPIQLGWLDASEKGTDQFQVELK